MADATDLKSVDPKGSCGFESRHRHQLSKLQSNEGTQAQTLGPELRGQAIEATRRLEPYGKTLRDAVDFYEAHLKSEASLRQIKLGAFIKEFLQAKEEGKSGKKRRKAKPRYLGTLRYRLDLLRDYLPEYSLEDIEPEHLTDLLESRHISGRTWNNYRRDFHVAFGWAVDGGYLLTNPAASVPEAAEDPINAQVLLPEEFSKLLQSAEKGPTSGTRAPGASRSKASRGRAN